MSGDKDRRTFLKSCGYEHWWDQVSGHLGGVYPFFDEERDGLFSLDISDIITSRKENGQPLEIDPASIASFVSNHYILGDRTLLKGVKRAPWMFSIQSGNYWEPVALPPHGMLRPDRAEFVTKLKQALLDEGAEYVRSAGTVGILLSGGMDSRVTAAVLRQLQLRSDWSFQVVALSWGGDDSRDVVYAQRIAKRFGWETVHYPLSAQTLAENIEIAGLSGAEVAPLHLHALPNLAEAKGIDVFIAGSYGDSVGRAEFSGCHLPKLKPVLPKNLNRFGLLRHSLVREVMQPIKDDVNLSPHLLPLAKHSIRRREIEQQMFYMRRMLQTCMTYVGRKKPLFQMFTAPEVFGLMWSLAPELRDNSWYRDLLVELPGKLLEIPWARTGLIYGQKTGSADRLEKSCHSYGQWLRQDLRGLIVSRVESDVIRASGFFNDRCLDNLLQVWGRATTISTNALDEQVSWLASLAVFITHYGIRSVQSFPVSPICDQVKSYQGRMHAEAYVLARNRMRE